MAGPRSRKAASHRRSLTTAWSCSIQQFRSLRSAPVIRKYRS
jgi:hypothetical protein